MARLSYDRYGLTGNPFRDLTSETLRDVEVFHVDLEVDGALNRIREEVFDKENRAFVGIVGAIGAGKTERLRVMEAEARRRKVRSVYVNVAPESAATWADAASQLETATKIGGFSRIFTPPPWLRQLATLKVGVKKPVDPKTAGRAIGEALNANAPAFFLLNDLHNLNLKVEVDRFSSFLQELNDALKPGVLVAFGCYSNFYVALSNAHPALASRVTRVITLPSLTNDQAALMIAKKLLAKRIVEALDPLFPFDNEAIEVLNKAAFGNPRRLLELADLALEHGVSNRSYRIDAEVALAAIEARRKSEAKDPPTPMVAAQPSPARPAAPATPHRPAGAMPTIAGGRPEYIED